MTAPPHVNKARDAEKPPGEWNQYEITARGDTVTLSINGKLVNRATGCEQTPGKIVLMAAAKYGRQGRIRYIPDHPPASHRRRRAF